jgi:hypothetical protein
MKLLIKKILKEEINRSNDICNIMSVKKYEDGINLLINYLGYPSENPKGWKLIEQPLTMWKDVTEEIRKEVKNDGMSGDSEVDESNTWWAAIQSTFCR